MSDSFAVWSGLTTVGIWTFLALFRRSFWRLPNRLADADHAPARAVAAVIPARDEEALIAGTVRSLKAQTAPVDVIVADDESSDRTGASAAAAGARVVRAGPRPPEWKGKLWAVSEGIRAIGGAPEFLLLTDADIEYRSPGVVAALEAKAREGFDLVSVMVRLRCESWPEKFLIPAFVFFFFKLYPPGTPAAAGGCLLIRREMLDRIGGIAAIRNALIDDCALAAAVAKAGGRVWLGISHPEVRSVREYGKAAEIRAMISRSAFAQLRHSVLLLAGTVLGMFLTYIAPALLLFSGRGVPAILGGFAWLLSAALYWPSVREYRAPWWTVFCLPGIAVFYLIATLESAARYWTGRGGMWKGRVQDRKTPAPIGPD
ncbi:MAG: glycosyltransferase [Acidobacteriota bacterium]|nr:glycosyltransferase [Acidobacteriota bacterium]